MSSHHEHPDVDCEVLADVISAAPETPAPGTKPPPNPVRFARLIAWGDRLATRLDLLLERCMPRELNPFAHLGAAANVMLIVATVSGVFMLIWYSPSVQFAWESLGSLAPRSLGGLMRSVHRYSSDLLMMLVLTHAVRMFLARKFADARWLAWASGIALIALVWFIGWTGYWLVWDVRAQLLALHTIRSVDVLPIFGEPMLRLFATDETVPSLLFFVVFFMHMVLPLGIAGGLVLHLARMSRTKLLPDHRLSAWLVGAVIVAALVYPATNAEAAKMAVKPAQLSMDWWYLWPLEFTARFSGGGIWLATFITVVGLMTVPWWVARRRPRVQYQAKVNAARCFSCTLCSVDCPFGAITMVERKDGKPFPSEAEIDPDRCIGCGVCSGSCDTQAIGMSWFDAMKVSRDLEGLVKEKVVQGEPVAVAFVCAQSDGGWEMFNQQAWEKRMPGYTVRPIPCSGWIEPKMIERLISKGAEAVLIVGCGSSEAFCKEGSEWVTARLEGKREPAFRPNRADPSKMGIVNFDLLQPQRLTEAAALLREQKPIKTTPVRSRLRGIIAGLVLTAIAIVAMLVVSDAGFRNPASSTSEFVFSFRVAGDWVSGDAVKPQNTEEDTRPLHMRTALPADRTRMPVTVRVIVDGISQEGIYEPKGLKSDGVSVGELRVPLEPGMHEIAVEVLTSTKDDTTPLTWTANIEVEERRIQVLSYEMGSGFSYKP